MIQSLTGVQPRATWRKKKSPPPMFYTLQSTTKKSIFLRLSCSIT